MTVEVAADFPDLACGPEGLFGLQRIAVEGSAVVGTMTTGPWVSGAGSLAVLVDDVLGYAILAARPSFCWSVSTEIALDLLAPVPTDGRTLTARGRLEHSDEYGGFALGSVVAEGGELIARCRQRGRYVPAPPHLLPEVDGRQAGPATSAGGLDGHLGPLRPGDGCVDLHVDPVLGNPLGNLHGGVTLAVSDLVAAAACARDDLPGLRTASIHATYVRPVPVGTILHLEPEVVSRGRTLAAVRVVGRNDVGKPCTVSTVTLH
jgi:acyl-coenzyme A thioesterase PaaI-like protein